MTTDVRNLDELIDSVCAAQPNDLFRYAAPVVAKTDNGPRATFVSANVWGIAREVEALYGAGFITPHVRPWHNEMGVVTDPAGAKWLTEYVFRRTRKPLDRIQLFAAISKVKPRRKEMADA